VHKLSVAFERFLGALALLAALILLAMVALVTADILLRNLMLQGFVWANEVSEYALYLMTLFTAPWLLRRGQHVRLDLVLTAVPQRICWLMEAVGDIAGFVICLLMLRFGLLMTLDSWRLGSLTIKNLIFPEWWLLAPLPAVFLLLAVEFVFRFHRILRVRQRREEATSVA
jgi:TRAP-type C4-dicarboxylate transport system permease small subunit